MLRAVKIEIIAIKILLISSSLIFCGACSLGNVRSIGYDPITMKEILKGGGMRKGDFFVKAESNKYIDQSAKKWLVATNQCLVMRIVASYEGAVVICMVLPVRGSIANTLWQASYEEDFKMWDGDVYNVMRVFSGENRLEFKKDIIERADLYHVFGGGRAFPGDIITVGGFVNVI